LGIVRFVKRFLWNEAKSKRLKEERGISFEDIIVHIERGDLLAIIDHPNQDKYSGQRVYVVDVDGYVYLVPFVDSEDGGFLKTVIPSRKATRDYLRGRRHEGQA